MERLLRKKGGGEGIRRATLNLPECREKSWLEKGTQGSKKERNEERKLKKENKGAGGGGCLGEKRE